MYTNQPYHFSNLIKAIKEKNLEQIRLIVDTDPRLLKQTNLRKQTCLHYAITANNLEIVEFFLAKLKEHEISDVIHQRDIEGWNVLHYAADHASYSIFRSIVKAYGNEIHKAFSTITDYGLPIDLIRYNLNPDKELIRNHLEIILNEIIIEQSAKKIKDPVNVEIDWSRIYENPVLVMNLNNGLLAAERARKLIAGSHTHPSVNLLDDKNYKLMEKDIRLMRNKPTKIKPTQADIFVFRELEEEVATITQRGVGNCEEYSMVVLYELIRAGIKSPVRLYHLFNGDHVFVVFGMKPNADLNDFTTWGPDAVVVDAWSGEVYPAAKLPEKLYDHVKYFTDKTQRKRRFNIPFDVTWHKLEPRDKIKLTDGFFLQNEINKFGASTPIVTASLYQLYDDYLQLKKEIAALEEIVSIPAEVQAYSQLLDKIDRAHSVNDLMKVKASLFAFKNTYVCSKSLKHVSAEIEKIIIKAYQENQTPLLIAVQNNDIASTKIILEKNDSDQEINGISPLLTAIKQKNMEMISLLLTRKANINGMVGDTTPLCEAIKTGEIEIVRYLLKMGADPNLANGYGLTPLYLAADLGNLDMVKLLLDAKADVNMAIKNGATPAFAAALHGHLAVLHLLHERKADLNQPRQDGISPLFVAAKYGYTQIVKWLLEKGVNADKAAENNTTPLLTASRNGHLEVVKLLATKRSVFRTNNAGLNAFMMAAINGHVSLLKYFVDNWKYEEDIEAVDNKGQTALLHAVKNNRIEATKYLILLGANGNKKSYSKNLTPLMIASQAGNVDLVRILLTAGAKLNIVDKNGANALFHAVLQDHEEIVRLLVTKNSKLINQINYEGLSPLMVAIKGDQQEMVEFLIQLSADINFKNAHNVTPLTLAIQQGDNVMINLLLDNGAHFTNMNYPEVAERSGYPELKKILLGYEERINFFNQALTKELKQQLNLSEIKTIKELKKVENAIAKLTPEDTLHNNVNFTKK